MSEASVPEHTAPGFDRREFLRWGGGALGGALLLANACQVQRREPMAARGAGTGPAFPLEEASLRELQGRLERGEETAESLTRQYLDRIEALDRAGPTLRAVLETNPDALAIARDLDTERRNGRVRGPLHGMPVLVKDNIATADRMTTTAGSLALEGVIAAEDAWVVRRLREAGAIILGKTNLSEWANFRSTHSTSGWSGRGGLCRNPWALDRNTSGSSSGSAAAASANLAAAAVGTETDGSIVSPSATCGIVGIKPTLGLVSRSGIVPIAHSQDTAGPMARTVEDAALLLQAMVGVDPADAITEASATRAGDYVQALAADGLRGARIGVPRRRLWGFSPEADRVCEEALDALRAQGAVLVDPADIPTMGQFGDAEFDVLLYEFKADLNAYLGRLPATAPVHSLADVIAFNEQHRDRELQYFGQEIMVMAEAKGPLTDAAYRRTLATAKRLSGAVGIDQVMDAHHLDALVAPTGGPAWLADLVNGDHYAGGSSEPAAVAGYPNVTVPAGYVYGLPIGLSFFGRAFSEATLLRLAYAFEQTTTVRRAPGLLPTADLMN